MFSTADWIWPLDWSPPILPCWWLQKKLSHHPQCTYLPHGALLDELFMKAWRRVGLNCMYIVEESVAEPCALLTYHHNGHRMGSRCTDFSCHEEGFSLISSSDENPSSPTSNQEMRICNDRPQSTWTSVARGLTAFHVQLGESTLVHLPDTASSLGRLWQRGRRDASDWVDRVGQIQLSSGLSNSDTVSAFLCNWSEPQYAVHKIIKNRKWYFAFETK